MQRPAPAVSPSYYSDFVTIPSALLAVALTDAGNFSGRWLVGVFLGLTLFTLVEYWTHREVLHDMFWSAFHQRHHRLPAEYVRFPWWYTPAILLAAWIVLPAPYFVGWTLGMIWFYGWHHVLHHWDLRKHPWLMAYSNWHELHHKDLPVNYGITHPGWDWVFGTYCSTREGHQRLTEKMLRRREAASRQRGF